MPFVYPYLTSTETIEICFKLASGDLITLTCEITDNVGAVKRKISDATDLPHQLMKVFDAEMEELSDSQRLTVYTLDDTPCEMSIQLTKPTVSPRKNLRFACFL